MENQNKHSILLEKLYSILNEFKNPEFNIEQKIYRKVCDFNSNHFKGEEFLIDSEFFYEETAFNLMEMLQENNLQGWEGLHYGPFFSAKDKNGNIVSNPHIRSITPEMVNYWEKRSSEEGNPILQCRYSGLVWSFSKKIRNSEPDVSIAHRFIDSVIQLANLEGCSFLISKLEKGLKLAISLNDRKRIISVRNKIIQHEEKYSEEDKLGTWGYSYDLLIGDKNLYRKIQLEKKQEDKIIKELERKLKNFSNKDLNTFKPYSIEYIVTKLATYYKRKSDIHNMKRVLLIYKDSFLYGIKNNLVMVGSHRLEKIRRILFQYGLSKEANNLESDLRSLQLEDLDYLKKIETPVTIPQEKVDNYISDLDTRNLSEALNYIAVFFIPDKEKARDIVLKDAKEDPLSFMIPLSIMNHTGRRIAKIDPIDKDLDGHVVHQISQIMKLKLSFIELGLNHLEKTKSLDANSLSKHLFQSPVFTKASHPIIKEGLIAYFNKNYIVSCSVLIHQIESAIRELISVAGGEIYQSSNNSLEKGFELRPLGALLRDEVFIKVFENFNNNIPDFFRILLVDKRSLNIRNSICHGDFSPTFFNKGIAIHIIHILLILSLLRKETKS